MINPIDQACVNLVGYDVYQVWVVKPQEALMHLVLSENENNNLISRRASMSPGSSISQ